MKKITKVFLIILLLLIIAGVVGISLVAKEFAPVSKDENAEAVKFEIPYGTSAYEITQKLKDQNLIKNQKFFYYLLLRPNYLKYIYPKTEFPEKIEFKSGLYKISPNMNYGDIIVLLSSGKQSYLKVSIPEGLTISKMGALLEENEICNKDDFVKACYDSELVAKYNIPANSFEGYLFPDTYNFDAGMKVESIIKLMVENFFAKTADLDGFKDKTPEEINQIVILASIVEREYKLPEEAPLIASVFTNRIEHSIGLYSCATIEYIITEIQGKPHPDRILDDDLKIDSPYNTYKWRGLTPGPISNPGIVALKAAAAPAKTNYYYFQVEDASIGKHVFTRTFDEHKLNHNLLSK